jgi:hypothetical protein
MWEMALIVWRYPQLVSIEANIVRIRELANEIHARAQAATVTSEPIDREAFAQATSDALLKILASLEELERRLRLIESERLGYRRS